MKAKITTDATRTYGRHLGGHPSGLFLRVQEHIHTRICAHTRLGFLMFCRLSLLCLMAGTHLAQTASVLMKVTSALRPS